MTVKRWLLLYYYHVPFLYMYFDWVDLTKSLFTILHVVAGINGKCQTSGHSNVI